jgi:RNA polymerase sigma-70 factor (ECF subfamily)
LGIFRLSNKGKLRPEEAELVSGCQKGDQNAMKDVFSRYHEKVYRVAYGVVGNREDALDIVQEVFVNLFRSIKNFKGESNFYTYIYRMAMNTAIDTSRKKKRIPASRPYEERGDQPSDAAEKRPDNILLEKELDEKMSAAMAQLPQDQKAAIIYRDIEGLSYIEMAEAMGCNIGTVMSRLHYARKRMRELLKDYLKEGIEE